nr:CHAT domain-containing protein [Xenococcaceae cyanobacterium MO_188.B32]
ELSRFPIVHIATHGQFSSTLEQTFLLAWDSRIDINKLDSILQTRNLSQEEAIELLVLSACETAAGDERAALGLAGMAVRAGARSTVATLWAVNDRSTAQLMSKFYQELTKKDITKAEAIRQAQLSLLHTKEYRHPFYWAAYLLLGNWL